MTDYDLGREWLIQHGYTVTIGVAGHAGEVPWCPDESYLMRAADIGALLHELDDAKGIAQAQILLADEARAKCERMKAVVDAAREVDREEVCSCPVLESGRLSPSCKMVQLHNALDALDAKGSSDV